MFEDFQLVLEVYPWMAPLIAFVFGAAIGSFLNVVVYRLPVMLMREWQGQALEILEEGVEDKSVIGPVRDQLPVPTEPFNLVVPNSRCPHCNDAIKPWHNIPILGYFLIGGKCATCSTPISFRYPAVEVLTALLSCTVIMQFGPTLMGLCACLLTWGLITLALIDWDTQLLPDDITLPLLWLGLIVNFFGVFVSFDSAFLGACAGYLVLWVVFQAFKLVTGKEGMGYGDFKMLAMLGAWLGLAALPVIVVLSSAAGAIIGIALILSGRDRDNPMKFGPFLAIAGWIALMWGDDILNAYMNLFVV